MRIIAGEHRGRRIETSPTADTRPTTDRVREALMSSLNSAMGGYAGEIVLDAFAGSGALGLEALSRGAASAVFFETDRRAQEALSRNIETLGLGDRARLMRGDVSKSASRGTVAGGPFTLILLDPPYRLGYEEVYRFLGDLADAGAVAPGAIVSYEFATGPSAPDETTYLPEGFSILSKKRYGKTGTMILQYLRQEDGS